MIVSACYDSIGSTFENFLYVTLSIPSASVNIALDDQLLRDAHAAVTTHSLVARGGLLMHG